MTLLTIITLLALLEYIYFGIKVGRARGKYDVKAPATRGNEIFERHFRVHSNTLEQLIVFLPALWAFGHLVSESWAAGLGVLFLVGRLVYAYQYVKEPGSRGSGILLSVLPAYVMVLGALVGAVLELFT